MNSRTINQPNGEWEREREEQICSELFAKVKVELIRRGGQISTEAIITSNDERAKRQDVLSEDKRANSILLAKGFKLYKVRNL